MERIAPAGDVYQAGTLSGNPLAVAAGLRDAARCSTRTPTRSWRDTTELLADGLREAAARAAGPVQRARRSAPAC